MKNNFHRQSPVLINNKKVLIDIKIQPIVNWLNSFKGIETVYSCEGNSKISDKGSHKPYVTFIFKNSKSLKKVLKTVSLFNGKLAFSMKVLAITDMWICESASDDDGDLLFSLYFESKKIMLKFCKFVS